MQDVLEVSLCGFFRMVVAAEVERWAIGYVDIVFLEYDDGYGQLCSAVADAYIISFFHVVLKNAPDRSAGDFCLNMVNRKTRPICFQQRGGCGC